MGGLFGHRGAVAGQGHDAGTGAQGRYLADRRAAPVAGNGPLQTRQAPRVYLGPGPRARPMRGP